jgi:hypothetical protein
VFVREAGDQAALKDARTMYGCGAMSDLDYVYPDPDPFSVITFIREGKISVVARRPGRRNQREASAPRQIESGGHGCPERSMMDA